MNLDAMLNSLIGCVTRTIYDVAKKASLEAAAESRRAAGGDACKRYTDTAAHAAGEGLEIFCVTVGADGAQIATLTPVTGFTSSGLTGVALAAGEQFFGRWSTITLTSGAVTVNECDAQA